MPSPKREPLSVSVTGAVTLPPPFKKACPQALSFTSCTVLVITAGGAARVNGMLQAGAADVELRLAAGVAARVSRRAAGAAAIVGYNTAGRSSRSRLWCCR